MTPQKSKTLSEKNQALSILINSDGLSFLTYNPATKEVGRLKSYDFQENVAEEELHEYIKKYLAEQGVTDQPYSDVRLCIANNLSTFVPEPLFDENKRATYLEDHADIRKHDFVSFDNVSSTVAVNVYIPYVNVNNMFLEMFGSFSYVHASSLLLEILSKKQLTLTKTTPIGWFMFNTVWRTFLCLLMDSWHFTMPFHGKTKPTCCITPLPLPRTIRLI